jgi:hypothetical protein
MPTVTLTDDQVIDLVKQLPMERKRAALLILAEEGRAQREARLDYAETQMRRLCADRSLDWDAMKEDEREAFVDDFIHEDRQCRR